MKNHFIPVNTIDKARAFANSLDSEHLKRTQLTKQNKDYIQTMNVIESLQKQGWNLVGVCEARDKKRITQSHYVKMFNPDFSMKENGKIEAESNLIISNSVDGSSVLNVNLGVYRLVCSNGAMRRDVMFDSKIKHNEQGQRKLTVVLDKVNDFTKSNIQKFETYKHKLLNKEEMQELARQALKIRFDHTSDIDFNQLLKVNRAEDKGNNLWLVYNRIQENLTKSNMLINAQGQLISGTNSVKNDIYVNNQLTELVEKYM